VAKGRMRLQDARRASETFTSLANQVKLVVTSPPYLDVTNFEEDQWLRLWFLGGPAKPITGQGKDDRHRRIESYWQFLREAWKGVAPLLQESAQVVIRIGGTRLGEEQLRAGLLESLNSTGHKFKLAESRQTAIKNGQRRIFQNGPDTKASVEHDFRFKLA